MGINNFVVSTDELLEISGCSSIKGLVGWLRKNKIPFGIGTDKLPRVARSVFNIRSEKYIHSELFNEIFDKQMLFDRRCTGIYFLMRNDAVVYIGRTTTFFVRMAAHDKRNFQWDAVVFCPTEKRNLGIYEAELIARYLPEYNISMSPQKNRPPHR